MACLPLTPTASQFHSDTVGTGGWVDLASVDTNALSRYYPLTATPVSFDGMALTTRQHLILRQVTYEETAATAADIKKCPLLLYVYGSQAPTAPSLGSVYNASTVRLIGQVAIAAADYIRVSDTVWRAVVNPNLYMRTDATSDATRMWVVPVSDSSSSVTYAASAAGRIEVITESGTSL
jgi:hypothetical protein